MCTDYYIEKLKDQKTWFIDTCAIVNHKKLSKFVANKEKLINNKIIIYVINPVYQELNRLLYRTDEYLAKDAKIGLSIILQNKDLFKIEGINERMDIDNAFADPDFYRMFSKNMVTSQLYITDDKKSAHDVNNHNLTWSFKNKKIFICNINDYGELVKSDCIDERISEPEVRYIDRIVEKEIIKPIEVDNKSTINKIRDIFIGFGLGAGLSTLFIMIILPHTNKTITAI